MFTTLPWQLDILVAEALISMVMAMWMAEKPFFQRTREKAVVFAIWDIACISLMIWAGHASWQHFLYVFLYLWAMYSGLTKGFRHEKTEFKPEHTTGVQVFAGVIALGLIGLIVTG